MSHLRYRVLHRSEVISVTDVECRCPRSGAGPEEQSRATTLAIARSGVFARHFGSSRTGSRTLIADANTVSIFRAGSVYRVSHPCDGGDVCTSIQPSPELLREILGRVDPAAADRDDPAPRIDHGPCPESAFLLQTLLVRALRSEWPEPLEADEAGVRLAAAMLGSAYEAAPHQARQARQPRESATVRAHRDLAERVKVHLAFHMGKRLDLAAVARAVHASPYHVSRVFRRQTGVTISAYLGALRLRKAVREVLEGECELSAAAVRAGFYDQSHFTNACRRAFGHPPSRLRELGPPGLRKRSFGR